MVPECWLSPFYGELRLVMLEERYDVNGVICFFCEDVRPFIGVDTLASYVLEGDAEER